jgi:hypothetical protein
MADPGICYCGNYGGGKHTKSARCPDSMEELRARIAHLQENNARLAEIAVELAPLIAEAVKQQKEQSNGT